MKFVILCITNNKTKETMKMLQTKLRHVLNEPRNNDIQII